MSKSKSAKPKNAAKAVAKSQTVRTVAKGRRIEARRTSGAGAGSKLSTVITLLRRPNGASIDDVMKATGWQAHSVRGAISGTIKKKQGLAVTSEKSGEVRVYRIAG